MLSLNQSVYGLRPAPRSFFQHLTEKLEHCDLVQSSLDRCLFIGKKVIAVIYIGDVLFYACCNDDILVLIQRLKDYGIAIHHEGSVEGFLGVNITSESGSTPSSPHLLLTQSGPTNGIIDALGLCSSVSMPIGTLAETASLTKDSE